MGHRHRADDTFLPTFGQLSPPSKVRERLHDGFRLAGVWRRLMPQWWATVKVLMHKLSTDEQQRSSERRLPDGLWPELMDKTVEEDS